MEDLENTISQILGNPESMAQIMSIAKSLSTPAPPVEAESQPSVSPMPSADQSMLSMLELIKQFGADDPRETQLLNALKPYCSEQRRQRIDRALQIARLSQIAGAALRNMEKKE